MKCRQLRNGLLNLLLILVFVNSSQVNKLQEEHQHQVIRHGSHAIRRSEERHEVSRHTNSSPLGGAAKQAINQLPCCIFLATFLNNDYSSTSGRGISSISMFMTDMEHGANNIVEPTVAATVEGKKEVIAVKTPVLAAPWENQHTKDDVSFNVIVCACNYICRY